MRIDRIDAAIEGGTEYPFPKMVPVDQHFDRPRVEDIEKTVRTEMGKLDPTAFRGKRIAITAGSRGIAGLVEILATVVARLRDWGAEPFIVPAMGSHGGATAEGQVRVLDGYGITEENIGAPILSSMDVVEVARLDDGRPLYCDKIAYGADGIVVCNKVKPHADFKAEYESGLVKMMALGLGKHKGAATIHTHGFGSFQKVLPEAGKALLENLPVCFGVAILENAFDDLMVVEVIPPERILEREKELLSLAKDSIARLLLPEIDVLVIDEIGKNISGEGMDPNVTGRPGSGLPGFDAPAIQKIVVLDVTPESHGNGVGIGMADITTLRCVNKLDLGAIYTNAITATIVDPAKIPLFMNNDREAIAVALKTCNRIMPQTARVVRIKNTLEVHRILVSEALVPVVEANPRMSLVGAPQSLEFDADGYLRVQ